jgi:hypothetical protein
MLILVSGLSNSQRRLGEFGSKMVKSILLPSMLQFSAISTNPAIGISSAQAVDYKFDDISRLKRGFQEVSYLLDHWEEKTTYCNFGEVKTEMLGSNNKEMLYSAARDSGLLDKSKTMNVRCKRDPEVVRAFVGLTNENTVLRRADALMKAPTALSRVDPDSAEVYMDLVDRFSRAVSSVDSLAYNARTDFDSSNTFSPNNQPAYSGSKYIEQSRESVVEVKESLGAIINILGIE